MRSGTSVFQYLIVIELSSMISKDMNDDDGVHKRTFCMQERVFPLVVLRYPHSAIHRWLCRDCHFRVSCAKHLRASSNTLRTCVLGSG